MFKKLLNRIAYVESNAVETKIFSEAVISDNDESVPSEDNTTERSKIVDPVAAGNAWDDFEKEISKEKIPNNLTSEERSDYINNLLNKTLNPDKAITEAVQGKDNKQIDMSDEEYNELYNSVDGIDGLTKSQISATNLKSKNFIKRLLPTVTKQDVTYSNKVITCVDVIFNKYVKNDKSIKLINDLRRSKNSGLKIEKFKIKLANDELRKV